MHTVEALQHSTRRAGAHERTLVGLGARIQQLELRSGDHGNGLQTVFEAAERDRETHSRRCAAAEQNLGNQESAINDLRQQMATSKCPCKQQIIASDPFDYQAAHQSRAAGKRPAVPSDYDTENEPLKQYVAERTRNPYAGQPRKPSPVRSDEDQGINVYGTDMQGHRTAQSPPHQGARDNSYPTRLKAPPPPRVVAGPSKQNQTQQPGGMRGEGDFCGGRNTGYDTNGVVPCRQRRRRRVWCDGCECGVNYD
ncbi:hypothetical protein EJ08DRAFT_3113 [Tothia fuscella]|uniref:Uncharacterized protein n=1 Tax=Tothia fuscella TaxID=1048955 RepID=A0A9P4P3X5_9PEZI|nr:hypothetical protein EJ08DRAFT_3113 [Tothia fuscella]